MVICGIDPGKRSAISVWRDGDLCWVQSVDGDDTAKIMGVIEAVDEMSIGGPHPTVVIEDQYCGRMGGKSLATLHLRRARWQVLAELHDMRVVLVRPTTWRAALRVGRSGKDGYMRLAHTVAGDTLSEDEAAAVCIGLWGESMWYGGARLGGVGS